MSGIRRYRRKNANIKNASALGVCDVSGFTFYHKDLVKQMEWRGDRLVWTGFMVAPQYLDIPQEQSRPPIVHDDPRPVLNPRIPQQPQPATFDRPPGAISQPDPPPYSDPNVPVVPPYRELLRKLNESHWSS